MPTGDATIVVDGDSVVVVLTVGDEADETAEEVPRPALTPTATNAATAAATITAVRLVDVARGNTTSLPTAGSNPNETSSSSGASTGLPHELQNAPEPCCV